MLLNSAPNAIRSEILANRASSSVDVLHAMFRRYQPGGLAKAATVEPTRLEAEFEEGTAVGHCHPALHTAAGST